MVGGDRRSVKVSMHQVRVYLGVWLTYAFGSYEVAGERTNASGYVIARLIRQYRPGYQG